MIVGIIILVIFAIILFISNNTVLEETKTALAPTIETVPQEFAAIQEYTTNCLHQVGKQGIIILGRQGGYISPETLGEFSRTNPTDSVGIILDPARIPYWHYNELENANPQVNLATLMPPLYLEDGYMSIEAQLGRFIDEEIIGCLGEYETFENRGFDIVEGDKHTRARIVDGLVDLSLEMTLDAERNDASTHMDVFHTQIRVDLKEMYETAKEITQAEENFRFLENQAIELLNIHARTQADAFVPFYTVSFTESPDQTVWSAAQLKQKLIGMLTSYVPVIRLYQGEDFYRYEFPQDSVVSNLYQTISDNMVLDIDEAKNTVDGGEEVRTIPYAVRFDYLGWDPYFDVNGGQEQIKPSGMYVSSPFSTAAFRFGYQRYQATYDFSYPVLVSIEDDQSFKGEGFLFNFALEANVINNNPIVQSQVQAPPQIVATQRSLACNENQRTSELIRTVIVDSYTHEPLELVNVGLVVPQLDFCDIGTTDFSGIIDAKYPPMVGGELEIANEGYLTSRFVINTYDYVDTAGIYGYAVEGIDSQVIEIHKEKEVNMKAAGLFATKCIVPKVCNKKRDACDEDAPRICMRNGEVISSLLLGSPAHTQEAPGSISLLHEYYFSSGLTPFTDTQSVTISLERMSGLENDPSTSDYSQFVTIQGNESVPITLVPGIYKVDFVASADDFIFVPVDNRCHYDEKNKGKCKDSPGTQLSSYVLGITQWDTPNSYFRVTEEDLYNSDTLEFTVLGYDLASIPEIVESVNPQGNTIEISGLVTEDIGVSATFVEIAKVNPVRALLEPRWSSTNIQDDVMSGAVS
jgi:hypothetical protein